MPRRYPALTFTESVKEEQRRYGSRRAGEMMERYEIDDAHIGEREAAFIAGRDGFYLSTVGENGWPYVQFRGGPRGFLKPIDEKTLGYADFGGNRQYISTGHMRSSQRASLFLMDYARRRRMKIMATAEVLEAGEHPDLVAKLHDPDYSAQVERIVLFHVEAFDWNCPQHITPRFTEQEIEEREAALWARIQELEAQLDVDEATSS